MLKALWYLGVIAACLLLVGGFLLKSWPLSIAALAAGLVLQKTNGLIPLPKIYRDMGIKNELFGGAVSNEEDHQ